MAENRPIIIKRVSAHAGHHGGAWKVAYADFVTAMMALFIVLWLLNSSKQIQVAVGGYFKDPTGTSKKVGSGQTGSGDNFTVTKENMSQLKEELQSTMQKTATFDKLKNQIEMTITAEGLRIELMETDKGVFFPSGVADPNGDGKDILSMLAKQIGALPNTVSIEGHTDAKPFSANANYGNWELSTDRANAARRLMQREGLGAHQVTQVRGFADQHLRKPEDPENACNRRISLIIHYVVQPDADEKAETPGAANGEKKETPKAANGEKAPGK
jgi:chemotaxis protein MotB